MALADLTVEECIHHRPGRFGGGAGKYALAAGSSPVVRLVLLALKTKAGLRLRRTSLATVLAPLRSAKSEKGTGGVTCGAGGGAQQKSGRVQIT